MYKHIKVSPNENNVGAIIEAELSKFNNDIIEEIKDALAEYGVVFFRNQNGISSSRASLQPHNS